jgi:TPR repeat protein
MGKKESKSKSKKTGGNKVGKLATAASANVDYGFNYDLVIDGKELFKQPPPKEDCPICFLRLPNEHVKILCKPCCGKLLCAGCNDAHMSAAAQKCPFCRTQLPASYAEMMERYQKRMEANDDIEAMFLLGDCYDCGDNGLQQDSSKAIELYSKAAKLGHNAAHYNLAVFYKSGDRVEKSMKKSTYHCQRAAIGGNVNARHNLGCRELDAGNRDLALKHLMIAANDGFELSMKAVREGYKHGFVTKDDLLNTMRAHGNSVDEMQSDDRDRSADLRQA